MRIQARVGLFAVVAALAQPLSAQSKLKVEKLADGVWGAQPERGANVGWFYLGDGVVAIDSGADAAIGQEVLKAIAETTGGRPVRSLVLTHTHADHTGGARAFVAAGARVICQEAFGGQVLAFVTQAATDPSDPMAGKPGLRPVVESISERAILVDGVHNVQIYFLGAAHTKGDLVIYLPDDRILFSGDIALNGKLPFMLSSDVDPIGWERVLQMLAKTPVEKIVPGHGEIGPKGGIAESLGYVRTVNEFARKFVESGLRDEMIDIQIRAAENAIPNVAVSDAHVANVKAAVRAAREKAARKPTPAPAITPTAPAK